MKHFLPPPSLCHWPLSLASIHINYCFRAGARHAGYLDYILSVTQAPPSQDKLSAMFIHRERENMKTSVTS